MKFLTQFPWLNRFSNIYLIISIFFVVWMLFFDSNSALIQIQLYQEIKDLEREKMYLQEEIKRDQMLLKQFADSLERERFAREKYYFKRQNEDIFIVEPVDSVNNP